MAPSPNRPRVEATSDAGEGRRGGGGARHASDATIHPFDAIFNGVGAAGSAAVYPLATAGQRVLGVAQYTPPHALGASHGESRIIRQAYMEGAMYVPLLRRAYTLWQQLERETGASLLHITGALYVGRPEDEDVAAARATAESCQIAHEMLTPAEVHDRFPAFRLCDYEVALWEPGAGYLIPEACIEAHIAVARQHGAELRFNEKAVGWSCHDGLVTVRTDKGTYTAKSLAICAGGWLNDLAPGYVPLQIERAVMNWLEVTPGRDRLAASRCPVFIWQSDRVAVYGLPDLGSGVKVGLHHPNHAWCAHPREVVRDISDKDTDRLRKSIVELLPDLTGRVLKSATCFYTNTPDQDHVIGRHPEHAQVVLVSSCSGHGFKTSNAVGEAVADLITGRARTSGVDLSPFALSRFQTTAPSTT